MSDLPPALPNVVITGEPDGSWHVQITGAVNLEVSGGNTSVPKRLDGGWEFTLRSPPALLTAKQSAAAQKAAEYRANRIEEARVAVAKHGLDPRLVAKAMGISSVAARKWMKSAGLTPSTIPSRARIDKEMIVLRRSEGASFGRIAKEAGCSRGYAEAVFDAHKAKIEREAWDWRPIETAPKNGRVIHVRKKVDGQFYYGIAAVPARRSPPGWVYAGESKRILRENSPPDEWCPNDGLMFW
jgi:hypothetical protein